MRSILLLTTEKRFPTNFLHFAKHSGFKVITKISPLVASDVKNHDLIISFYYPYILDESVIDASRKIINCHPSYLPYGRGSAPNMWAIAHGTLAGVTIHEMVKEVDKGDIITQKMVPVLPHDTGHSLDIRLYDALESLLISSLEEIYAGAYISVPQTSKKSKTNTMNDFHKSRCLNNVFPEEEIKVITEALNIIRAYCYNGEHDGAFIKLNDGSNLYIHDMTMEHRINEDQSD